MAAKRKRAGADRLSVMDGGSRRQACIDAAGDDDPLVFIDGHDCAILGIAERDGEYVVVYDSEAIIHELAQKDRISVADATEFFAFNIAGSWVGAQTPIYLRRL